MHKCIPYDVNTNSSINMNSRCFYKSKNRSAQMLGRPVLLYVIVQRFVQLPLALK